MPVPLPAVLLPLWKHCCTQPNASWLPQQQKEPHNSTSTLLWSIPTHLLRIASILQRRQHKRQQKKHSTEAHTVSRSKASVGIWTPLIRRAPRAHKKPSGRGKITQTTEMFVRERKRTRLSDVIVDTFLDECATLRCNKTHTWSKQGSTNRDPYGGTGILLHFDVRLFRSRWQKEDDDDDDDIRCSERQRCLRCFHQQNTRKQKYKRRLKLRATVEAKGRCRQGSNRAGSNEIEHFYWSKALN